VDVPWCLLQANHVPVAVRKVDSLCTVTIAVLRTLQVLTRLETHSASGLKLSRCAGSCAGTGLLKFFNTSAAAFEHVATGGLPAIQRAVSAPAYPDGVPVVREAIFPGAEVSEAGIVQRVNLTLWVRCSAGPGQGLAGRPKLCVDSSELLLARPFGHTRQCMSNAAMLVNMCLSEPYQM
jgi:hypothetical protein